MQRHRQGARAARGHWEAIAGWLGGFKPLELILGMVGVITLIAALHAMWYA